LKSQLCAFLTVRLPCPETTIGMTSIPPNRTRHPSPWTAENRRSSGKTKIRKGTLREYAATCRKKKSTQKWNYACGYSERPDTSQQIDLAILTSAGKTKHRKANWAGSPISVRMNADATSRALAIKLSCENRRLPRQNRIGNIIFSTLEKI